MSYVATNLDDLPSRQDLLERSGLEFLQDIINGTLSGPPIAATMGFKLISVNNGEAVFVGTPDISATNPMRTVHGGWYGTLLDSTMGCAVMTMLKKGQVYTTLEYKVNITRAVPLGTNVRAVGLVNHAGRSTSVATGEIRGIDDDKLYATGSTTCIILDPGKE